MELRLAIEPLLGNRPIGMAKMFRLSAPYFLILKICLGLSHARAAHAGCVSICSANDKKTRRIVQRVFLYVSYQDDLQPSA
jgi:hypothetical protein